MWRPALLAALLFAVSAAAQTFPNIPYTSSNSETYTTIGTTAVLIVNQSTTTAPPNSRKVLVVCNQSATASVAISLAPQNSPPPSLMPTINGVGHTIPPTYCWGWSGSDTYVPSDAVYAIASVASTPISIEVY